MRHLRRARAARPRARGARSAASGGLGLVFFLMVVTPDPVRARAGPEPPVADRPRHPVDRRRARDADRPRPAVPGRRGGRLARPDAALAGAARDGRARQGGRALAHDRPAARALRRPLFGLLLALEPDGARPHRARARVGTPALPSSARSGRRSPPRSGGAASSSPSWPCRYGADPDLRRRGVRSDGGAGRALAILAALTLAAGAVGTSAPRPRSGRPG